ncbi:unnamed protein product [Pleuronectes platessa]|uniref:Uncharacterized protein n=1 Tax=Pleuronectes platessa TaxID=8262 RepID=A0A9N7UIH4_PLEPL|nr:unnamed protein product [Pleuronectes platessa]
MGQKAASTGQSSAKILFDLKNLLHRPWSDITRSGDPPHKPTIFAWQWLCPRERKTMRASVWVQLKRQGHSKGQVGMCAFWQLDRPKRVRALARFTALTPSDPRSACEPPTTITTAPVCHVPAQPRSLVVRCAPARHWPSYSPAAHYVKGPRAPCHSVHLPSSRPESRIREERATNTRHSRF